MHEANVFPDYRGHLEYVCLGCKQRLPMDELHYTCPSCKGVFLLEDGKFASLAETAPQVWRERFDARAASKRPALRGIFRAQAKHPPPGGTCPQKHFQHQKIQVQQRDQDLNITGLIIDD